MHRLKTNTFLYSKKNSQIWGLIISGSIGILFCLALGLNLLNSLQLRSNDFFFQAAQYNKSSEIDPTIVIVGIDDKSIQELGKYSSWPRSFYSQIIDELSNYRARVVVMDILFSDPDPEDQMLATSIKAANNVVLPVVRTNTLTNSTIVGSLAESQDVLRPTEQLEQSALAIGHANISADQDGIVRRLPVQINTNSGNVPALSITTVAKYLRRPGVVEAPMKSNTLSFAGRSIPLNEKKEMLINYSISPEFTELSFVDVLHGNVDPKLLEDKIVLIGTTAVGLGDYFWTPMGFKLNGVEIHAHAIDTILSNNFLAPASKALTMGFILLLSLSCGLIVLRVRVWQAILAGSALVTTYLLCVFLSFDRGLVLNAAYPPLAILGTFLSVNLYKLASEQSQKIELIKLFGRFVSAPVAEQVIHAVDVGQLDLGGNEKEVTVLFADVRGFASLSEKTKPKELVKALNVYLSVVIEAVLKYDGIINKFGGDSIMAIWNTPIPHNDHAWLAVRAAAEAQRGIKDLQEKDSHLLRMDFGIGISTGIAVAGSMGSQDRIEYSVIGDCVNTAARITGLTPMGKIWIGENTQKYVSANIVTKSLEALEVKGKEQPVKVYEVVDVLL